MNYKTAFGILISLLFISIVILFCIAIIKLYIQKIKKYNQIIYQKEIDYQTQLNQTILETQEQTFQDISQELHDDAGQQLTFINFQLENLKLDFHESRAQINPVSNAVKNVSNSIRQLSHSLNNQLLSQQDVLNAIKTETQRLNENKNIEIEFKDEITSKIEFSVHEKIVIYRIFQECINNSLKHAKATKIEIIANQNPKFKLTISDNGKGFDVDYEIKNTKSNGLQNIQSRAELIDYTIQIKSQINKGTIIQLEAK